MDDIEETDIEEDDIEEDDFEEDTNFCSGKIPFNINCEIFVTQFDEISHCGKFALMILLHNLTKFYIQFRIQYQLRNFRINNLTKFSLYN